MGAQGQTPTRPAVAPPTSRGLHPVSMAPRRLWRSLRRAGRAARWALHCGGDAVSAGDPPGHTGSPCPAPDAADSGGDLAGPVERNCSLPFLRAGKALPVPKATPLAKQPVAPASSFPFRHEAPVGPALPGGRTPGASPTPRRDGQRGSGRAAP